MYVVVLTVLALIAFAANSILCRLALGAGQVDPATFTVIRLVAGAIALAICVFVQGRKVPVPVFKPMAALLLFGYAACFSYAYVAMATGTGALLLFGVVQLTMLFYGWVKGGSLGWGVLVGTLIAFAGLVYLLLPSVAAPSLLSALLMGLAGLCWGFYTLFGVASTSPLQATMSNFIYSVPLVLFGAGVACLAFDVEFVWSTRGALYALVSGAITSGIGYAIWYKVLPQLRGNRAASLQLSVPIIAGIGGWVFVAEPLTLRFLLASVAVLGGVYLAVSSKSKIKV